MTEVYGINEPTGSSQPFGDEKKITPEEAVALKLLQEAEAEKSLASTTPGVQRRHTVKRMTSDLISPEQYAKLTEAELEEKCGKVKSSITFLKQARKLEEEAAEKAARPARLFDLDDQLLKLYDRLGELDGLLQLKTSAPQDVRKLIQPSIYNVVLPSQIEALKRADPHEVISSIENRVEDAGCPLYDLAFYARVLQDIKDSALTDRKNALLEKIPKMLLERIRKTDVGKLGPGDLIDFRYNLEYIDKADLLGTGGTGQLVKLKLTEALDAGYRFF